VGTTRPKPVVAAEKPLISLLSPGKEPQVPVLQARGVKNNRDTHMRRRSGSILDDSAWKSHRQRNTIIAAAVAFAAFVALIALMIWVQSGPWWF
jgi:hypothetical protein